MEKLLKATSRTEYIVCLRLAGVASLVVGIVTAATDKAFGGWTPIFWFLLAFAGFFGVLCNELYRIILLLEGKKER
jgi:hypothetical protein